MRQCAILRIVYSALIVWLASALPATSETRHVVLIYDERTALPGLATIDASIVRTLTSESSEAVPIYSEGMDLSRFGSTAHVLLFRDYLGAKYASKQIDVAVAVLRPALDFLLNHGDTIFPGAAIVFCGIDKRELDGRSLPSNVTGVLLKRNFSPTLELAIQLQPDTKRIVVVAGTSDFDLQLLAQAREELRPFEDRLEFTYLTTLPLGELLTELAQLPPRSIVLYTSLFRDGAGQAFVPHDAVERISAAANVPVYGFIDQFLGRGIVGGRLYSLALQGKEAARLASRILAGMKPSELPALALETSTVVFDWRQLRRWGIHESRLPVNSEVRFREPSVWDQYYWQIILIGAALISQTLLIGVLLHENRRRRRAEAQRRRSEAAAHELSGRLINAQEEERARVARELHDDVTQRLASLAIDAGREERNLGIGAGGTAMRTMREGLARLSEDVHMLSYRLHPSILEDLGLIEALKSECERFSRMCSTRLEVNTEEITESPPRDVALCLFRVTQEALRNIARHAGASRAQVSLRRLDGGLQLAVRDNGAGFDPAQHFAGASLGHGSMRQRAFLLGGKVDIDSSPGHGTTVLVWVPLRERSESPARVVH